MTASATRVDSGKRFARSSGSQSAATDIQLAEFGSAHSRFIFYDYGVKGSFI